MPPGHPSAIEWARREILSMLRRVRRIDLGTIYLMMKERAGALEDCQLSQLISSMVSRDEIALEVCELEKGALVGFVQRPSVYGWVTRDTKPRSMCRNSTEW